MDKRKGNSNNDREKNFKPGDPGNPHHTNIDHSRAFYPVEMFPQFKVFEENYLEILKEYIDTINENKGEQILVPWVEKNLYQESIEDGWNVAPLMIGGNIIEKRCKKFPKLHEISKDVKGIVSISFSSLKPGTHIVPHRGYDDYSERVLRFHMGLIVPEGDLGLRVEKEIRKWTEGKSFVFDDYLIHEAWNFTNKNRVVLIIDFLREEVTRVNDDVKFIDNNFNKSIKTYIV